MVLNYAFGLSAYYAKPCKQMQNIQPVTKITETLLCKNDMVSILTPFLGVFMKILRRA